MTKKFSPFKTPSPANYPQRTLVGFIDHSTNSLKSRAPNWTAGAKFDSNLKSISPSPAKYDIQNFTSYGKNSSPAFSMYQKSKPSKSDKMPGPSSYKVRDAAVYRWNIEPKFTMRPRLKPLKIDSGSSSQEPTPIDLYKEKQPQFSFRNRLKDLNMTKTPGPKYEVDEAYKSIHASSPSFSHRWRLSDLKKTKSPGPNLYNIKSHQFDNPPSFSMGVKYSDFTCVPILPKDNC